MFTEAEAYEALGLELKNDEGPAPEQDAPPEGQDTPTPAREDTPGGDVTPDGAGTAPSGGEDAPPAEGGAPEEAPGPGPAPEQDAAAQQQIRRAVERALAEERERQQEQMRAFFRKAQLKNTVTGADIASMEDFEAWERDYQAQRLQQELSQGKLSPETLERAIEESPAVRQAQELARKAREQEQAEAQARFQVKLREEMAEIQKLDPSARSLEDVVNGPNGQAFCRYVRQGGLSFLDAFRLANMDALQKRFAEQAAGQAAREAEIEAGRKARSKDHLTGAGAVQGTGGAAVPPEAKALFREFLPEASESEIQSYYDKYERSVGK